MVIKTSLLRAADFKCKAESSPGILPIIFDAIVVPEIKFLFFAGLWRSVNLIVMRGKKKKKGMVDEIVLT